MQTNICLSFDRLITRTCEHPKVKWLLGWIDDSSRNQTMQSNEFYHQQNPSLRASSNGLSNLWIWHLVKFLSLIPKIHFLYFGRSIFSSADIILTNRDHGWVDKPPGYTLDICCGNLSQSMICGGHPFETT